MNKTQIGENAGIVWNILKDNKHWEYEQLKEISGLSDRELNAAIGWLAREDKIDFDMNQEGDRIFLTVNVFPKVKVETQFSTCKARYFLRPQG